MGEPISVFATHGPLTVSVNGGAEFTVPAGSRSPSYLPGSASSGVPQFGWPTGPNVLIEGTNQITVTPHIEGFEIPPKTFTIVVPSNTAAIGDSCQLYLVLDWTFGSITWMVCISGLLCAIGNSSHGQMPWPPAPPSS
jgi:hypothetical protein